MMLSLTILFLVVLGLSLHTEVYHFYWYLLSHMPWSLQNNIFSCTVSSFDLNKIFSELHVTCSMLKKSWYLPHTFSQLFM